MGRAILDEAFRNQLFTDPEAAIHMAGLNLSESEMTHLKITLDQFKQNQTADQINHQFEENLQQNIYW
jgi:hypothetical protein